MLWHTVETFQLNTIKHLLLPRLYWLVRECASVAMLLPYLFWEKTHPHTHKLKYRHIYLDMLHMVWPHSATSAVAVVSSVFLVPHIIYTRNAGCGCGPCSACVQHCLYALRRICEKMQTCCLFNVQVSYKIIGQWSKVKEKVKKCWRNNCNWKLFFVHCAQIHFLQYIVGMYSLSRMLIIAMWSGEQLTRSFYSWQKWSIK